MIDLQEVFDDDARDRMTGLRQWAVTVVVAADAEMLVRDPALVMRHAAALAAFADDGTIPERVATTPRMAAVHSGPPRDGWKI